MTKIITTISVSEGEISSLFFWSYDAKCLFKERSKKVSYWKLAIDESNQRLFYGASDGSIKQRSIGDTVQEDDQIQLSTDNAKRFQFFGKDPYLAVSQSDGRVKVFAIGSEQTAICEFDFGDAYSNYNVLALEPNAYRGMLGNIRGEVTRFELNVEQKKIEMIAGRKLADHKLFNLFVAQYENERELVACGPDGEMIVCSLVNWSCSNETKFKLPVFKYRQVNCVLKLSKTIIAFGDRSGNVIVYKSKIACEEATCEEIASCDESMTGKLFVMIKLFRKVHSLVGGCKQLIRHPFQRKFYSCGRDGRILEYEWSDERVDLLRSIKPSIEMDAISRIEFDQSNGDLVYVIGFRQNLFVVWNNHTQSIVWTVQSSGSTKPWDFVISSTKLSFVYLKRNQLLYASKTLNQCALLRAKHHSNIVLCAKPLFLKKRDSAEKNSSQKNRDEKNLNERLYFLTGCEDSELFINSLNPSTGQTTVEAILHGHISNVRTCVVEDLLSEATEQTKDLFGHCLVITAGSASNLMVWDVKLDSKNEIKVKQLFNYFIWGPDRETMNLPWIKKPKQQLDSQLRFMDASLRRLPGKADYLLSTVCSDATLRLFALSPSGSFIHLLASYRLSGYCPLRLLDFECFSLITSTDGSMRLVEVDLDSLALRTDELVPNFPSNPLAVIVNDSEESALDLNQLEMELGKESGRELEVELVERERDLEIETETKRGLTEQHPLRLLDTVQAHRFGVNSIDSIKIGQGKVLVFSVGEDTSIGYTLIALDGRSGEGRSGDERKSGETSGARVLLSGSCPSKHCSMVSQVKAVGGDLLLTASWDQRIKIWQFSLNENGVELCWLQTIVSSIADISEVLIFADGPVTGWIDRGCVIDQGQTNPEKIHQTKINRRQMDEKRSDKERTDEERTSQDRTDQEATDQSESSKRQVILVVVGEGEEIYKIDLSA